VAIVMGLHQHRAQISAEWIETITGEISRARVSQGPPALRWALYEAAQRARFPAGPDRPYYEQLAARIGGNRACLALAQTSRGKPEINR